MSPTDFCNYVYDVRATKPGLSILAGTEALTSFRFFRATTPSSEGSDPGQAALRPVKTAPVLVPSR